MRHHSACLAEVYASIVRFQQSRYCPSTLQNFLGPLRGLILKEPSGPAPSDMKNRSGELRQDKNPRFFAKSENSNCSTTSTQRPGPSQESTAATRGESSGSSGGTSCHQDWIEIHPRHLPKPGRHRKRIPQPEVMGAQPTRKFAHTWGLKESACVTPLTCIRRRESRAQMMRSCCQSLRISCHARMVEVGRILPPSPRLWPDQPDGPFR